MSITVLHVHDKTSNDGLLSATIHRIYGFAFLAHHDIYEDIKMSATSEIDIYMHT